MTSNSYSLRCVAKVLAVFVLFFATYALLPSPTFAEDTIVDTTLQGNYSAPTFTALTSIPGVQEAADSKSIAILLNNLYRICIGAAAVIAVLKIIQGGVTYMLGDSVTEKKEAKHHITMAVLGLVFILSPYLVFNIIDPRILSLDIDVSGLTPDPVVPQPTAEDYTDDGEFLGDGVGQAGGGAGKQGTGAAGLNWVYRFASGEYFFVLGNEIRSPEEGINCYSLYGQSHSTVETCREQKTEWYEEGDTTFYDCARSDGNDVRVHIDTNLPICEF